jgi:glutamate-1-semialdehyde 2,1-aminomutase
MLNVERTLNTATSEKYYHAARHYTSLGVQGANKYYAPYPIFFKRAQRASIWDADDNQFIDLIGCLGANILGHSQPEIVEALINTMRDEGFFIGAATMKEVQLAKLFCEIVPCADQVYFTGGGGSDPVHFALRGAKALTRRKKIVKHEGSYHGWSDLVFMNVLPNPEAAGPSDAPTPSPDSLGISEDTLKNTLIMSANNKAMAERIITQNHDDIAAVIVEPVMHTMGVVPLKPSYLQLLRQLCDHYKIVLIFDEVLTGFRHALGGVQSQVDVTPDMAVFGKAMTNGQAFTAALAGRNEVMSLFPEKAKLTGTFIASLVGCTAALKTIELLKRDDGAAHKRLYKLGDLARDGLNRAAEKVGVSVRCHSYGSIWCLYPTRRDITCYRDLLEAVDFKKAADFALAYRNWLLNNNIVTQYGRVRAHLNVAHSEDDIAKIVDVSEKFFKEFRSELN